MRDWQRLHQSFERLWSTYGQAHENGEIGIQVLREAMNPERYTFNEIERDAERFRLEVNVRADWQDLELLRDAFMDLSDLGFSPETPADSVYQTAIQVRLQRLDDAMSSDGKARWFYRGQRDHRWQRAPKMMRELGEAPVAGAVFVERLQRVRTMAGAIMQAGLAHDDFEATAIVQHYSTELETSTWLLDVSESPWIALFFASDGGKPGEIGQLEYIELTEWMLFSGHGENSLGAIRAVSPASVLRIENQKAFFLQAPHPDLFEELSVRKLWFRQQQGVVFESEGFHPALNRNFIYPVDDPTLPALRGLTFDMAQARPLQWEPAESALRAPDWQSYLPIARVLLDHEVEQRGSKEESTVHSEEVLSELCKLHAAVRSHRGELPHHVTTLHHLRRVIVQVLVMPEIGMPLFLEGCYLQHLSDAAAREAFQRCLCEASLFWKGVLDDEIQQLRHTTP